MRHNKAFTSVCSDEAAISDFVSCQSLQDIFTPVLLQRLILL
ncbi:hypothetical protein [Thermaurantimonas sp.]